LRTYLDANATTPMSPEVSAIMHRVHREVWGNASSVHTEGRAARQEVEKARSHIAAAIGATPADVIFTSGATEANNTAISAAAAAAKQRGRTHIVASAAEHPSVIGPLERLERDEGFEISWVKPDTFGRIVRASVLQEIRPQTGLIAIMAANNETGNLFDVPGLISEIRDQEVHIHVDCVQHLGKETVDVQKMGASSASFSAHKIYGPKGIGALYWRAKNRVRAFLVGGHQERERRAGTEAVALIAGFGEAARQAKDLSGMQQTRALRDLLWQGLCDRIEGIHLNGDPNPDARIANTVNVSFDNTEGETLLISLDLAGFSVSSGSACTAGSLEPSHVLVAMDMDPERARAAVRFSLTRNCTEAEICRLLDVMPEIVETVRSAHPSGRDSTSSVPLNSQGESYG